MRRIVNVLRRRRVIGVVLGAGLVALGVLAVLAVANAPGSSGVRVTDCVTADGECVRFPSVTGTNLLGETFDLPEDFAGAYTLVLMPFDEEQTARMAEWLPVARSLAVEYGDFAFYDVPTLAAVNPLARTAITAGMVFLIPDESVRAVTIMLFLEEKQVFLDALDVGAINAPLAMLLNDAGEVVWKLRGGYSDKAAADLRAMLAEMID